jgi:hypothetical protein
MFRFVTAAFGQPYLVALHGLIRSFLTFAPNESLTIFTDMPIAPSLGMVIEMDFMELMKDFDDFYKTGKGQLGDVFKFSIFKRMMEIYPNDDICWIDADMLVFCELSQHLKLKNVNIMAHGRRDEEIINCGEGLSVQGKKYAIGGFHSLPSREAVDYLMEVTRHRLNWTDAGSSLTKGTGDQIILNHLVAYSGIPVNWISDDRRYIFNLEVGENVHPVVGDKGLSEIKLIDGKLFRNGGNLLCFVGLKINLIPT